jgi:hypothetical protein
MLLAKSAEVTAYFESISSISKTLDVLHLLLSNELQEWGHVEVCQISYFH